MFTRKLSLVLKNSSFVSRRLWSRPKMPLDSDELKALHVIRTQKRKQHIGNPAASADFTVIGCGSNGLSNSLLLRTDGQRYMFNCGEVTQRLCNDLTSRGSLAKLAHIFITRRSWENLGGLLGTILSIRGVGSPDVTIHGPEDSMLIYDSTKHFIVLHDFALMSYNQDSQGVYEDGAVAIRKVSLKPEAAEPIVSPASKYSDWKPVPAAAYMNPALRRFENHVSSKVAVSPEICAYIVRLKPKPRKLDFQKCLRLGVTPGPLLGILKSGKDVTLENGNVVRSADVTGEEGRPLVYIVVECPNADYLTALKSEPLLQPDSEELSDIQAVFHFTPPNVVNLDGYTEWMNSFPDGTKNVMINGASTCYKSKNALVHNYKMNMIMPDLFPRINTEDNTGARFDAALVYPNVKQEVVQASTGLKINVRPELNNVEPHDFAFKEETVFEDTDNLDDIKAEVASLHKKWPELMAEMGQSQPEYPKVTFLGTGSSQPSRYRNVSCILVETEPDRFVVLDCGEGSVLQMFRLFGRARAQSVMRKIRAVYVSHLHADHHLGLINLVKTREAAFAQVGLVPTELFLVAPSRICNYLLTYHQCFESILVNMNIVNNEHLLEKPVPGSQRTAQMLYADTKQRLLEATGLETLTTVRADHCPASFCLGFVTKAGFKVVYSGDTRPVKDLVTLGRAGQPTDLLIHEATMEHIMLDDAMSKRHSTFVEAIEQGRKMGAKYVMLTHMSQRYTKIPTFGDLEGDGEHFDRVGVAFDFMTVSPKNLFATRQIFPALKLMFAKDLETMNDIGSKYGTKSYTEQFTGSSPPSRKKKKYIYSQNLVDQLREQM